MDDGKWGEEVTYCFFLIYGMDCNTLFKERDTLLKNANINWVVCNRVNQDFVERSLA